jgi:SAM-dependent methyltransferase
MPYSCIACHSERVSRLGPLPVFAGDFLGKAFDEQVDAGSMYRCAECSLQFRSPAPSAEELVNYYGELSSDELWQHDPDRHVFQEIKRVIQAAPEHSILDVGCFRGDLLSYLGDEWDRFGIEPSSEARRAAEARGIKILAETIETRPLDALSKLSRMLLPGGQIIIFTGNTAAWSWRFAGSDYWYSAMPEHVAFFDPGWFEWAAPKLNCRVNHVQRLCYQPAPARVRIDEALKNVAYVTYRRLERSPAVPRVLLRLPLINRVGRWQSCWWTSARDHILVVLTKDGSPENSRKND